MHSFLTCPRDGHIQTEDQICCLSKSSGCETGCKAQVVSLLKLQLTVKYITWMIVK